MGSKVATRLNRISGLSLAVFLLAFGVLAVTFLWHPAAAQEQATTLNPQATATNGSIVFQRGSDAANDIPFNRGGELYVVNPAPFPSPSPALFGNGSQPHQSLDATKRVFLSYTQATGTQIAVTPADSYSPQGLVVPLGGSRLIGLYPRLSPNATVVAYQNSSGSSSAAKIVIIATGCTAGNENNTTTCNSTKLDSSSNASNLYPAWHPEIPTTSGSQRSGKIVFVRKQNFSDASGNLFVTAITFAPNGLVTEGTSTQLTNTPGNYSFPAFSPNGQHIIFRKDDGLWIMKSDGSGAPSQIKHNDNGVLGLLNGDHAAWSPDGTKIAFDYFGVIYTADLAIAGDGTATASNVKGLPSAGFNDMYPSWGAGADVANLNFDGKLRDRVSQNDNVDVGADGQPDGTFTVTIPTGANHTLKSLKLQGPNGNSWDTVPNNGIWVVGAARTLDEGLLNNSDGQLLSVALGNDIHTFKIFVSDTQPNASTFVAGASFTLTITFGDNSTTTASTTLANTAAVDLAVTATDTPDPVVADSTMLYVVNVANLGLTLAPNVKANIAIPDATLFVPSGTSSGCVRVGTGRNVECSLGNIAPGDNAAKQIAVRPTGTVSNLTFNVSVTSNLPDANTANNAATASTTVLSNTAPANDNFLNAAQFSGLTGSGNGSNVGATRQIPINYGLGRTEAYELNHADVNGGKSVWYYWTPPADSKGVMLIDTEGSNFDTLLSVYSIPRDPSDLSIKKELASNDDSGNLTTSAVLFPYDAKYAYYIAIDGKQGATGNIVFKWIATPFIKSSAAVDQHINVGIFPSVACTASSNAPDICDKDIDSSGYFVLKIKGTNFNANSEVLIKGVSVKNMQGRDRSGITRFGQVSVLGTTEIEARIPPNPPLSEIAVDSVRVVTRRASSSSGFNSLLAGDSPNVNSVLTGLADGVYDTAYGSRGLQTFEAQSVTILPGQKKTTCFNLAGNGPEHETCMEFENTGPTTATFSPTFFVSYSKCLSARSGDRMEECTASVRRSSSFAINLSLNKVTVRKRVDLTADAFQAIKSAGGTIALGFEGGKVTAGTVASGGGKVISNDGNSLISQDGGSLISQDGGSLISQDGGSLISQDGGSLISQDGGSIIGPDGASFTVQNGGVAGLTAALSGDSISGKGVGASLRTNNSEPPAFAAGDGAGVSGTFIARSSGGQGPTFTTETDPLTGEVKGYLTITLDSTSFPRASDVNGMAFTVLVNPAVVKFSSNNITVDKSAGRATITLTRTGDSTGSMTVDYKTDNGTGNDRSDYSPVFGSVTFAPGETTKQVTVPVINHGYGTGAFGPQRSFNVIIVNVTGGTLQAPNYTTVTVTNNDPVDSTTNRLDVADAQFFVRQQYLDLLGREPSADELASAAGQITQCGNDQACVRTRRVNLSYLLFQQYEQAASFVFRLYRAAFGNNQPFPNLNIADQAEAKKLPGYAKFLPDIMRLLAAGNSAAARLSLAQEFIQRAEFVNKYPNDVSSAAFVDAILATIKNDMGVDLISQRTVLLNEFDAGGTGQVLYRLADDNAQSNPVNNVAFIDSERNRAFVATLYSAYLRRDADPQYVNRLQALGLFNDYRGQVDSFVNSTDYRTRFGLSPQTAPSWDAVVLASSQTEIKTWTTSGHTYAYLKLSFPNSGYRVASWGQASLSGNNFTGDALVEKFSGASVQAVTTTAGIYDLGMLVAGNYNFTFKNSGQTVKTLPFTVAAPPFPVNPIDNAREFVKQQYRDFLNREADQAGEDFWTDNIAKCTDPARRPAGQTAEQCTLRQRETTSGAFFLSPEFQYTGYFVYRMYQGALGRQPKLSEFTPDALFVGNGIVVNGQLSAAKINQNRADFAAQFVNCTDPAKYRCSEFKAIYDGLTNQQYVDKLFQTTGVNASGADRAALVNGLDANPATETRASVLQKVVDGTVVLGEGNQQFNTAYGQAFYNSEFTRAFVQLEYFGYMKRDPDEAGYAFWLGKLNQFGGDFVAAEMVLAFISSPEYRARFGQP